jgi:CDP-diacylglycerol--glycerol-3-phosphate 3-phosphatidyltransferase
MSNPVWNVPNVLTMARIVFSILIFVVLPFGCYEAALILFILGSLTDFADGWWARHFHQVTKLGRILDPFADKLLVCGTLIYLVAIPELRDIGPVWAQKLGLAPWMVVVIVSRELLVTMLRSIVEGGGGDFSAKWLGKIKMGFQSVGICACFVCLILAQRDRSCDGITLLMIVCLWGMIWTAVHSCVNYIFAASRALKQM